MTLGVRMRWKAFTFGQGGDWEAAASRLKIELADTDCFDEVLCFNLSDALIEFKELEIHREFLLSNERGFGYWLWKPLLMHSLVARYPSHGIAYFDAGCELKNNFVSMIRFRSYLKIAERKGLLIFKLKHLENLWSKADLIYYLLPSEFNNPKNQASASVIFCGGKSGRQVINQWAQIACANDYNFITDSASIIENLPNFIEHRHDQSILSLLSKKYGFVLKRDETHGPKFLFRGITPIWAIRNRTGKKNISNSMWRI
jgi:hypothetical protein